MTRDLESLYGQIEDCKLCPRLREHCETIGDVKRRAFSQEIYWKKPIRGFGDPRARIVIVGLAPAAHGANRTGRIFTGDRSGEWLYRALYRAGLSNQAVSSARNDGLELQDAFISCVVKCAPPDNKPNRDEIWKCSVYLEREIQLLSKAQAYIALGQIALDGIWPFLAKRFSLKTKPRPKFSHGSVIPLSDRAQLILSYHPSQQNTFTKRLTEPMFDEIFKLAKNWVR